jgi:6,7-dimethyl-8-ribityllumazine synthase
MKIIEGVYQSPSKPVALVAARFNALVVDRLIEGACDALTRHGVLEENIHVLRVPGALEIGPAARRVVDSCKYSAVIALGCVIRGETAHFDQVVSASTRMLGDLAYQSDIPVVNAVLTTEDLEQAQQRAGAKSGNKGFDAGLTALEMSDLLRKLGGK